MGTINYRTSDYITMGIYPQTEWDFRDDEAEIIENMLTNGYEEEDITDNAYTDYVYDLIASYEEDDYYQTKEILEEYDFENFTLSIEAGYYQGFSLNIEYEHDGWDFDDIEDKNNAKMEVERVKECLKRLADIGLTACYPSWRTSYEDYDGTLAKIEEACAEMLEDIRKTNVEQFSWEV